MGDTSSSWPGDVTPTVTEETVKLPSDASGVRHVMGQIDAERRRLTLMRLAFAGLFLLWATATAWTVLVITFGAREGHATTMAVAPLLWTASSVATVSFALIWGQKFRYESLPEFLGVLFGGRQLIRGRHQFRRRLVAECYRARQDRRHAFSLMVIQYHRDDEERHDSPESTVFQEATAAVLVRSVVRADDIVAQAGPGEVWSLILGAGEPARERVVQRVGDALSQLDGTGCQIGASTFGPDGDGSDELLAAAYRRLASASAFTKIRIAA